MGNTVPPRMCRKESATAAGTTAVVRRRPKNTAAVAAAPDAAPRPAAVTPRKPRGAAEQEDATFLGRRGAGGVGTDDAVGKASAAAATVATVKIVLKRKDAEALLARLNAQSARERKARMAELKGELGAVECGGGGASPASCRDAWRPQLAPIKEN